LKGRKKSKPDGGAQAERPSSRPPAQDHYILKMYVTGTTPTSARAILNITSICDRYLKGHYALEVVDIYQQPHLAKEAQIIAAPTLVKTLPLPLRKIIGDMSDEERVLLGLNVRRL
jgi:circadian clock protein KaiB